MTVEHCGYSISHEDLDFVIWVRSKTFAYLEGPVVKCEDRDRVVIPDDLSPTTVQALAEIFTEAHNVMEEMPEGPLC